MAGLLLQTTIYERRHVAKFTRRSVNEGGRRARFGHEAKRRARFGNTNCPLNATLPTPPLHSSAYYHIQAHTTFPPFGEVSLKADFSLKTELDEVSPASANLCFLLGLYKEARRDFTLRSSKAEDGSRTRRKGIADACIENTLSRRTQSRAKAAKPCVAPASRFASQNGGGVNLCLRNSSCPFAPSVVNKKTA